MSLVARYNLDEPAGTSGTGSVLDASGNAFHGTPSVVTFGTAGIPAGGTSATFAGSSEFNANGGILIPGSSALLKPAAFTLSAWVFPTDNGNYPAIVWKSPAFQESQAEFALYFWSTTRKPTLTIRSNGTAGAESTASSSDMARLPTAIPLNAWTHLAATYAGTTATLYVNGVGTAYARTWTQSYAADTTLGLGVAPSGAGYGGGTFVGRIDDARIYDTALSASEVLAIYNAGLALAPSGSLLLRRRRAS